jgi:hypothetical protein
VKAFVELFRDIVLWRKGPQDLPASTLLLALAVLTYVAASAAQLAVMGEGGATWFFFLLLDPALLAASVWLMLKLYSHPERFLQTATAVLGAGAYLSIVLYLPLQVLITLMHLGPDSGLSRLLALLMLGTFALVTGRILQHGTGATLFTGVAFALTYFFFINLLLGLVQGGGA